MLAKDLIAHFATRENVPIDVQDHVVPALQAHTQFDLWFWPMPLNTEIYRGLMVQREDIPWGNEIRTSVEIQYADSLSTAWQRLICCKELIHVLDPLEMRVTTEAAFQKLIEKIVLPPGMHDASDGLRVWSDRVGIWHALAVLFPWATRELLMTPYQEGKISLDRIAEIVDLPREYVAVVMDEGWAEAYHIIAN